MRKTWLIPLTALTLLLSLAPAFPAMADHGHISAHFSAGTLFSIGPLHFDIQLRSPRIGGPPIYFYRAHEAFHDHSYRCTSRCYREGSYYYHDPDCPALLHHFDAYGYDRYENFDRWAPGYGDSYLYYRGHDRRYDSRYGSRYDSRYDGRYDSRYDHRYEGGHDGRYEGRHDGRHAGRHDDNGGRRDGDWRDGGRRDRRPPGRSHHRPGPHH
jgi:hypothetical protein